MVTHSLPSSLPAGFWSKAYIFTSEEVDKGLEVANVIPVNRSTKAIPINTPCFLVLTGILGYDMHIYIKHRFHILNAGE